MRDSSAEAKSSEPDKVLIEEPAFKEAVELFTERRSGLVEVSA
ncbi:MAG: hypothetical protein QXH94_07745 [Sulfolobales archaeon]